MTSVPSSDDEDDLIIDDTDYVQDAELVIYNHNEISIQNALVLNKKIRSNLVNLREELERMLFACQQKYKKNEELLADLEKTKPAPQVATTYYFCGSPFFKDRTGVGAPQPADYLRRRDKNELFPIDLLSTKSIWLPRDKIDLVQGVKKQIIKYLESKNRDRIRQAANKRCAHDITLRLMHDNDNIKKMVLADLLKKADGTDFKIDWLTISLDDLGARHTDNECIAIWNGYLMPSLNRKEWSPEEEDKLLAATQEFREQNWSEIAKRVENRSAYQCFIQYRTAFGDVGLPRHLRWTPEEDQQLMDTIEKYRIGNVIPWTKILDKMSGRSKLQLYNRYMFTLNPQLNRSPFTVEEDCVIMAAIKEYGVNFRIFPPNLIPGRNMRQIRSRYNNVLKHVSVREHWTEGHDVRLMELVEQYGTSDWANISEQIIHHNRTSCRQRYTTIKKFLEKHPNQTIADVPRRRKAFSSSVTTENWMETIIQAKQQNFNGSDSESETETESDLAVEKNSRLFAGNTLRGQFFENFKYSYNFEFGHRSSGSDGLFENIQIACQLLQAPSIPHQMDIQNESLSKFVTMAGASRKQQLEAELLSSLMVLGKNDFLFPVNYNTVLGLRGLVIMFETLPRPRNTQQKPIQFDQHEALNTFKMRFNALFKQTASVATLVDLIPKVCDIPAKRLKRKRKAPESTSTKDFDNNATLVRVMSEDLPSTSQASQSIAGSARKNPITVLESITLDLGSQNIHIPSISNASTSIEPSSHSKHYRIEQSGSSSTYRLNIQPMDIDSCSADDFGLSDVQTDTESNTDFIIWNPTPNYEVAGSAPSKKLKQNYPKST